MKKTKNIILYVRHQKFIFSSQMKKQDYLQDTATNALKTKRYGLEKNDETANLSQAYFIHSFSCPLFLWRVSWEQLP